MFNKNDTIQQNFYNTTILSLIWENLKEFDGIFWFNGSHGDEEEIRFIWNYFGIRPPYFLYSGSQIYSCLLVPLDLFLISLSVLFFRFNSRCPSLVH